MNLNTRGNLPLQNSFIEIEPERILVTAIKQAEDGQGVIVRLFNPGLQEIKKARLIFFKKIKEANEVNLAEEKIRKLKIVSGRIIKFNLRSKGLITFLIISDR